MASLADVRTALATNAATLSGVRSYAYMPDQVAVGPSGAVIIVVDPGDTVIEYDQTFGGDTVYSLRVRYLVGRVDEKRAQARLDAALAPTGAGSLKACVESDQTLGGIAAYVMVLSSTGYGEYSVGTAAGADEIYLGAELIVSVRTAA